MSTADLAEIAQQLTAPGKGLLASDESTPTIGAATKLRMHWKAEAASKCTSEDELRATQGSVSRRPA